MFKKNSGTYGLKAFIQTLALWEILPLFPGLLRLAGRARRWPIFVSRVPGSQSAEWERNAPGQAKLASPYPRPPLPNVNSYLTRDAIDKEQLSTGTVFHPTQNLIYQEWGLSVFVCERVGVLRWLGFQSDQHKEDTFSQSNDTSSTWQRSVKTLDSAVPESTTHSLCGGSGSVSITQ